MAISGDHVIVKLDDSGGTLRTFADGDIISVDLGLKADQHDVTGFGDQVHRVINGQMQAPVTIRGYVTKTTDIGTHPVIYGAFNAGAQVSLEVRVGNNAAPTTGDPKYTGEFFVASYVPVINTGGAVTFTATLNPATGTKPVWGVV
jgi:hypothetical protein